MTRTALPQYSVNVEHAGVLPAGAMRQTTASRKSTERCTLERRSPSAGADASRRVPADTAEGGVVAERAAGVRQDVVQDVANDQREAAIAADSLGRDLAKAGEGSSDRFARRMLRRRRRSTAAPRCRAGAAARAPEYRRPVRVVAEVGDPGVPRRHRRPRRREAGGPRRPSEACRSAGRARTRSR